MPAYSRRILRLLYDSLSMLADAVGPALAEVRRPRLCASRSSVVCVSRLYAHASSLSGTTNKHCSMLRARMS